MTYPSMSPSARPPLDLARLRSALAPSYDVEVVDAAPSTNALVVDRARQGAAAGLVIVAEHQTSGRGRLDRSWTTPARAALTLSVLLRPAAPQSRWPWLPLLTGVAVVEALRAAGAPTANLKWPNDVLLADLKVAGLLLEAITTPNGPAAVIGIGLNVSSTTSELPVPTATSLGIAGVEVDRTELLVGLLGALGGGYDDWGDADGDPQRSGLSAAYADVSSTVGQSVRVDLPGGASITGEAMGIADGGGLVVAHSGTSVTVGAGDVVHVRPWR